MMLGVRPRGALRFLTLIVLVAGLSAPASPAGAITTFTVTTTGDPVPDGCQPADCSLREAVTDANATTNSGGPDVVEFDIAGAGPHMIQLASPLPNITESVTIDGYSQAGASQNSLAIGNDAAIMIEIDGQAVTGAGFQIGASGVTITGLAVGGFSSDGIRTSGGASTDATIVGNFIGVGADGVTDAGNAGDGIELLTGGHAIGGSDPADRNVISGNTQHGISFTGSSAVATVQGNHIGTDAAAAGALPNGGSGLSLFSSGGNQVGGSAAGAGNVISGNMQTGIVMSGSFATDNIVQGNLIGTNAAGTSAVGNGADGVLIVNLTDANTIGGTDAGAGNLISGNTGDGVEIWGHGNTVVGNTIGLSKDGLTQLGNGTMFDGSGIELGSGASDNIVGGTEEGAGNTIAGNTIDGVQVGGADVTGNLVQGNTIGLAADGTAFGSPAQDDGVRIANGASGNTLGGTVAGAGNVVSGNLQRGIRIDGAATTGNVVQGNLIGTDPAGSADRGNTTGVLIQAPENLIGGAETGAGNVIGFNGYGVVFFTVAATGNVVAGNSIGTDPSGAMDLGGDIGVHFSNASGNMIGGTEPGAGNHIAYNGTGILLEQEGAATTIDNALLGNSIHDQAHLGIDLRAEGHPFGPTANDGPGDPDEGPNDLQNFPDLSAVTNGSTHMRGNLHSSFSTTYRLEFFSNTSGDPSGYGEGEAFIGAAEVMTDEVGSASFALSFEASAAVGDELSATATELAGDGTPLSTSEFSATVTVAACSGPGAGTPGDDILCGTPGDDLFVGTPGDDYFIGGGGSDTVSYAGAPGPVHVDLGAGEAVSDGDGDTDIFVGIENVIGSSAADVLFGDGAPNVLRGGPGADLLVGRGGDDLLVGQGGADTLRGGPGIDKLKGNAGRDLLVGAAGNDVLAGGGGPDDLRGGGGNDVLKGQGGNDTLNGGPGNRDRCRQGPGTGPVRKCER